MSYLLLISATCLWSQEYDADSLFRLKGLTVFSEDSMGIRDVHVLNLNRGTGTVSSYDGSFSIHARHHDTIKFSCIGYHDYFLRFNQTLMRRELMIFLKTDTVLMDEVLISPLGPRRFFKLRFMETRIPEEKQLTFDLNIPELKNDPAYVPETGIRFTGPVQALYNVFNKSARLSRKLKSNREKYSKYLVPEVEDSLIYPEKN
ncbi:MAG: hypothetical protein RQ761_02940 [Bacteroidales bacterium]|nr:hypothetical protein [Bacteroidales bacterium]